jgi:hypothetical protein
MLNLCRWRNSILLRRKDFSPLLANVFEVFSAFLFVCVGLQNIQTLVVCVGEHERILRVWNFIDLSKWPTKKAQATTSFTIG